MLFINLIQNLLFNCQVFTKNLVYFYFPEEIYRTKEDNNLKLV
ncbi:hypothetical protein M595_4567 [Lyngbya aestuarii BL J]|uniref:Uncharacterized protein n=1 Tax=Lyngbya aestuarii BL J TaxID=1348334 RepID=U7QCB5_9CYAN|nr:hypothetical protein M595_4567 [Lyngbya aestuarii BL J]